MPGDNDRKRDGTDSFFYVTYLHTFTLQHLCDCKQKSIHRKKMMQQTNNVKFFFRNSKLHTVRARVMDDNTFLAIWDRRHVDPTPAVVVVTLVSNRLRRAIQ